MPATDAAAAGARPRARADGQRRRRRGDPRGHERRGRGASGWRSWATRCVGARCRTSPRRSCRGRVRDASRGRASWSRPGGTGPGTARPDAGGAAGRSWTSTSRASVRRCAPRAADRRRSRTCRARSRARAARRSSSRVPGSPRGALESLGAVEPLLEHALEIARRTRTQASRPPEPADTTPVPPRPVLGRGIELLERVPLYPLAPLVFLAGGRALRAPDGAPPARLRGAPSRRPSPTRPDRALDVADPLRASSRCACSATRSPA